MSGSKDSISDSDSVSDSGDSSSAESTHADDNGVDASKETRAEFIDRLQSVARRVDKQMEQQAQDLSVPSTLLGKLQDFQVVGFRWLVALFQEGLGGILADEMGSGKTVQTITFLLYHKSLSKSSGPSLILLPLSILQNWRQELDRFAGSSLTYVIYHGTKEERAALQSDILDKGHDLDLVLMTYELCLKDFDFVASIEWQLLVVDEAHRLKNSNSLLFQALDPLHFNMRILLTGTPIQNNLQELNSLMHFANPTLFQVEASSFVEWFSTNPKLLDSARNKKRIKELQDVIRPFMLRRQKSEVVQDLPDMNEVVLYCGISSVQKKLYKSLLTKDLAAFHMNRTTSLSNTLMQLRKCTNHPYIFPGVEPEPFEMGEHLVNASGKLQVLDRLLAYLKERGHRVLIFSQMTMVLDILQDYLTYRGYSYDRLDGNVRADERFIAVSHFSSTDTFVFLLSTRAGGVGLNLTAADVVIFFDSDFNPQADLQAAARVHRIGQTKNVTVLRLISRGTVEEVIFRRAQWKRKLTENILAKGAFSATHEDAPPTGELSTVLKFGLDKLLDNEESTVSPNDFEQIFQIFEKGGADDEQAHLEEEEKATDDTIYFYQGKDYSKERDAAAFAKLESAAPLADDDLTRKRKAMTLDEKYQELELARIQHRKELEQRRVARKHELWLKAGYVSTSLPEIDVDSCRTAAASHSTLKFLRGSITTPQVSNHQGTVIIGHCVDNSGNWSDRGVFKVLSQLSESVETAYVLAKEMENLHVGDAHLVEIPPADARKAFPGDSNDPPPRLFVCLLVVQKRTRQQVSGILPEHLKTSLGKLAAKARELGASVHLARIGQSTPDFDWYATERIIKNTLCFCGVETCVYYFARGLSTRHDRPATQEELAPTSRTPDFPDVFNGANFSFYSDGQSRTQRKFLRKLVRYIVAYGGVVADFANDPESKPSHVVFLQLDEASLEIIARCEAAGIVSVIPNWVVDSIIGGTMQDPKFYRAVSI